MQVATTIFHLMDQDTPQGLQLSQALQGFQIPQIPARQEYLDVDTLVKALRELLHKTYPLPKASQSSVAQEESERNEPDPGERSIILRNKLVEKMASFLEKFTSLIMEIHDARQLSLEGTKTFIHFFALTVSVSIIVDVQTCSSSI
jgi:hypothetical protein